MEMFLPSNPEKGKMCCSTIIRQPADGDEHIGAEEDGSEFLNESGEGMEVERSVQGQTSTVGEPPQSGVVY